MAAQRACWNSLHERPDAWLSCARLLEASGHRRSGTSVAAAGGGNRPWGVDVGFPGAGPARRGARGDNARLMGRDGAGQGR